MMGEKKMGLPPGFEFDPSDEELILHFLSPRAANLPCYPNIIPDLHIYAPNPWDLDGKAFRSKKEWYFFSRRCKRRKGLWKEVGVSGPIFTSNGAHQIGIKYYLVFHSDDGIQTNWLMEEYHLLNDNASTSTSQMGANKKQDDLKKEWVLCRVHEANSSGVDSCDELSYLDEAFFYLDEEEIDEEEISFPT